MPGKVRLNRPAVRCYAHELRPRHDAQATPIQ
jgi:hypothetical protein